MVDPPDAVSADSVVREGATKATLVLEDVSTKHQGWYFCGVVSPAGRHMHREGYLAVKGTRLYWFL